MINWVIIEKIIFYRYIIEIMWSFDFVDNLFCGEWLKINNYFYEEFAEMFDDYLTGYYDGSTFLYRIVDKGDNMLFIPVNNPMQIKLVDSKVNQAIH